MLMSAVAFNLKKYMKFKPTKSVSMAMALEEELERHFQVFLMCSWEYTFPAE
jgi:hypothetical protein